jgi:hypothetical protein
MTGLPPQSTRRPLPARGRTGALLLHTTQASQSLRSETESNVGGHSVFDDHLNITEYNAIVMDSTCPMTKCQTSCEISTSPGLFVTSDFRLEDKIIE